MRGGNSEQYASGLPFHSTVKPEKYCVLADLLIPGKGDPIQDGCLVVEGGKIMFAGKAKDMHIHDAKLPQTRVKVLMPGMWDCHVHRKQHHVIY